MKIEAGKYYRTRDGQKVGPMIDRCPKPHELTRWKDKKGTCWHEDGRHLTAMGTPELDLIAEWTDAPDLTAITTPFGLLDDATREALKAHGGPYQVYGPDGNWTSWPPGWHVNCVYRVKPSPPKPREWWVSGGNCIWDTYTEAYNACDRGEKPVRVREVT
jgi:hypothetical protein